jgi:hypothetical protein
MVLSEFNENAQRNNCKTFTVYEGEAALLEVKNTI